MLFPSSNDNNLRLISSIVLGVLITTGVIVVILINQSNGRIAIAATATPTKTPTKLATASPTFSPTPRPTNTSTVTATPTATQTPSPTATATNRPTPLPPSATFTPVITAPITATVAVTDTLAQDMAITVTLELTQTTPVTNTGVIMPVDTPTPSPTPVPRTVLAPPDIPDYALVEDHLWFRRPYTEAYHAWGGYYYPYGTNAQGKYFWHFGIDVAGSFGTPIVAVGDGTVVHAGPDDEANLLGPWPDFYGQAVVIEHDRRWQNQPVYTLYGHISRALVSVGQQIKAGDLIAEVGQGGVATGPHLHLEVRLGARTYFDTRNPDLWVRPDPGFGLIAGRVVDHQGYLVPQQLVTLHRANDPSRFWRQTYTYPDNQVNSDDDYVETFTFSDVPAGQYLLKTFFDGRQLTVPVTVTNGATGFVLLEQSEPPRLPQTAVSEASPVVDTPPAEESPTPETTPESPEPNEGG